MVAPDAELLAAYAHARDEGAFTELVRRHLDLVYAAALRQVGGDAHLAHDVTQAVFTDLSRKAATLSERGTLAGWLYTSTHFAASKIVRTERTRRKYEEESIAMQEPASDARTTEDWRQLHPVIDAAMLELEESDREAVLLRFFTGRSFAEIGAALRLNEDTARKRVSRALDLLHGALARRGIRSTSAALTLAIAHHASAAAPAGLVASVSGAALAGTAASSAAAVVLPLTLMNKLTMAAAGLVIALLGTSLIVQRLELVSGRAEVTARQTERTQLAAEVARLNTQASVASPASATPPAPVEVIAPSYMTTRWGGIPQILVSLDATYASLFRQLKLGTERTDVLKGLLAERQRIASFELRDFIANEEDAGRGTLTFDQRKQLETWAVQEIDQRIHSLLGEAGFAIFRRFENTREMRTSMAETAKQLQFTREPLRDEQIDGLVQAKLADHPSLDEALRSVWLDDGLMARAKDILSPFQYEALVQYWTGLAESKPRETGSTNSTSPPKRRV